MSKKAAKKRAIKKKASKRRQVKKKTARKVGRPTAYQPKYAAMLREYFDIPAGFDVEAENSKGVMQSVRHAADFPTLAGFACKIGVHRETLLNWANQTNRDGGLAHPEFFDAYKRAAEHQERILVQNGLKGGYVPNFAIFTAKNVLGWRDRLDVDQKTTIETLGDDELDERIRVLEKQLSD